MSTKPDRTIPDPLHHLLARQEIRDVVLRYCRGVDRLDLDAVRACYHPDATDEHGSFTGGVDAFLAWIGRLLPCYTMTMHVVANHLVEFAGPDLARAETYGIAYHRSEGGDPRGNLHHRFPLHRRLRPARRRMAHRQARGDHRMGPHRRRGRPVAGPGRHAHRPPRP
ncbi:nuclear transport factor 2 family protein [Yinghuangia aomiensis]